MRLVGFVRYDDQDDECTHADVGEAYGGYEDDGWDIKARVGKVFWGVADSRVNRTWDTPDPPIRLALPWPLTVAFAHNRLAVVDDGRERSSHKRFHRSTR